MITVCDHVLGDPHSYVDLVETWGSDQRIIEAARMSTQKGFQGWGTADTPGDEKLLRYLYEHKHFTPFEMAGATLEIQAPIVVFREWHRHRTQSYNEMSGRYTELPAIFYVPTDVRVARGKQSKKNKQGSSDAELFSATDTAEIVSEMSSVFHRCRESYEMLLRMGLAKELARLVLPVAQYSKMRASANLRNWLHFLTLRLDPAAQWEIRQYAESVALILKGQFPRTFELFEEGRVR